MKPVCLSRISKLDERQIAHLIAESRSQGFQFVDRLVLNYRNGSNCFDQPGEVLLAAIVQGRVVGIGGLNCDPYWNDFAVGRLRHLYVESAWRKQGIGCLLVNQLVHEARQHYRMLTLRTDSPVANRFYQELGFKTQPQWSHTTHHLQLSELNDYPFSTS